MEEKDIKEGRSVAWLSYLGILILIPILVQKDNPYTKFHIKQGLILLIFSFGWWFLFWLFMFIPFLRVIFWVISFFVNIFILVLVVIGIINALTGKTNLLPLIGELGEKLNI